MCSWHRFRSLLLLIFLFCIPHILDAASGKVTGRVTDAQTKEPLAGVNVVITHMVIAGTGYMMNYDERGFTAGLGIRQDLDGMLLRADYGYMPFGLFGAVHHLSFGFGF